jgi:hypothetical protein
VAKPEWMPQRLYQWTKPRSLMLHLLFVTVAGGCLIAGWWQINRAMQGNTLSYLYSIEWPAFAIVGGIGWWQLFHDTPEDIAQRTEYHRKMRAASAEVVARTLPRSARSIAVGSHEVSSRALGAGGGPAIARNAEQPLEVTGGSPSVSLRHLPQPGDPREAQLLLPDDDQGPSDEMTEYNRYLAYLAVKGRPKTWRNPQGLR